MKHTAVFEEDSSKFVYNWTRRRARRERASSIQLDLELIDLEVKHHVVRGEASSKMRERE